MSLKKLSKVYHYIRCIPKTIFFNFYYLPFTQAIHFPILVNYRTKFIALGGSITVPKNARTGKIKLGFGRVQISDNKYSRFLWNVEKEGIIHFGEHIKVGTGSKLHIRGALNIASECNFTGEATIICNKEINFGQGCLISWQTLFMDSDLHRVSRTDGTQVNTDKTINIQDKVWIGARSTILKGVEIGSNSVVASGAIVTKEYLNDRVIGNNSAKVIADFAGLKFHS